MLLPRTVVRFALVGVANTAIDLALFWVLLPSLGVVVANVVSTSAGMVFSFRANGRHTFGAARLTSRQAAAFVTTNVVSLWLVQPLGILGVHEVFGLSLVLAKPVSLGASVVSNFLLYRYVVWPREPASGQDGTGLDGTGLAGTGPAGLRTVRPLAGRVAAREAGRR